jgi:thiopeptide-type bacteriocin biosynthesis protein
VFAADSAAVLAQRQLVDRSGADAQAVTVAALVDLAIAFVGDTTDGMGWLSDQPQPPSTHFDRAARDRALRLADPSEDWATLRAVPGGDSLLTAWRRRRVALADYRQALAAQRDPSPVLPSLLHLHHIRMFGIDPDQERRSMRLVRAAALRWHATTSGAVS